MNNFVTKILPLVSSLAFTKKAQLESNAFLLSIKDNTFLSSTNKFIFAFCLISILAIAEYRWNIIPKYRKKYSEEVSIKKAQKKYFIRIIVSSLLGWFVSPWFYVIYILWLNGVIILKFIRWLLKKS